MFMLEFFYCLLSKIVLIETSLRVLDKGILPLERNSVAIQFYLDLQNEDKLNVCKLRSRPKMCCLTDNDNIDCDIMDVYGEYRHILNPKYRDTILYIYPTIAQHDQVGYCCFLLEHQCGTKKIKRETVKIPFDTRLRNKAQYLLKGYIAGQKITSCETFDQDSLNECSPVNCDVKYSGNKPFYDIDMNKCVKAVECLCDPKQLLPDVVYVPKSNTCRDLNRPLTVADIYAISTGLGVVKDCPKHKEYKVFIKSNCSTISQNLKLLKDLLYGKLFPLPYKTDFSKCCNCAIRSIMIVIFGLTLALLLCVLCVHLMSCTFKKWKKGELKKSFRQCMKKFKTKKKKMKKKNSKINNDVKIRLLKEVIVSNLPLELRDNLGNICDRLGNEMTRDKAPMMGDHIARQVNFKEQLSSETSTTSDLDDEEKQKLLK